MAVSISAQDAKRNVRKAPSPAKKAAPRPAAATIVSDFSNVTEKDRLRDLIGRANARGRSDVARAAFRQICRIDAQTLDDPFEGRFLGVLAAFEEFERERSGKPATARAARLKLKNRGAIRCLSEWALAPEPGTSFAELAERGLLDLSGEHLVLSYADRFEADVVAGAEERLRPYGGLKAGAEEDAEA